MSFALERRRIDFEWDFSFFLIQDFVLKLRLFEELGYFPLAFFDHFGLVDRWKLSDLVHFLWSLQFGQVVSGRKESLFEHSDQADDSQKYQQAS